MKVAIISTDNSIKVKSGGKHVHQELLFKGLMKLGLRVQRIYYDPDFNFRFILRVQGINCSLDFIKYALRSLAIKLNFMNIIRFFKEQSYSDYDVIHAHDVLAASGANSSNLILTVHGYFAREVFDNSRYLKLDKDRSLFEWLFEIEKIGISKARKIIAVDNRIKKYLMTELNIPKEKVIVLPNAIDDTKFIPVSDKEKSILRKKLGIPKDAFVVILPRRFVPKNGVIYAVKAFSELTSEDYFFVIAGRGFLKNDILKILKGNKNFILIENLSNDQIVEYYQASDMVLIPSVTSNDIEEATSLSMLEGMACGKVVVCTNVGGMKEIISHMENGILIEQKNVQAIKDIIVFVKKNYNRLDNLRKNAREYVVKKHGYMNCAKRILDIYKEVIKSPP